MAQTTEKTTTSTEEAFELAAEEAGVPLEVLRAICWVESRHESTAFVYSDGGKANHAVGVCQVLVSTGAKFLGEDPGCRRDFKRQKIERNVEECHLFGAYENAFAAAMYLRYQLDRYKNNLRLAVAAYNAGGARICKTGQVKSRDGRILFDCEIGELINAPYVDKVFKAMKKLEAINDQKNASKVQGSET